MICLSFEASTPEELREKVCNMAAVFGANPLPAAAEKQAPSTPVEAEPKAKSPGRPKKEKTADAPAPAATPAADDTGLDILGEAAPAPAAKKLTVEDVRTAVSALLKEKGAETARKVMTEFNAQKVPDVKEADFAAFIERCNALIAGK
jgi:hypothetical protein